MPAPPFASVLDHIRPRDIEAGTDISLLDIISKGRKLLCHLSRPGGSI